MKHKGSLIDRKIRAYIDRVRGARVHVQYKGSFCRVTQIQNDSNISNISQDTTRCSNQNLYKMSLWKNIYIQSAPLVYKNGLYKMMEPKAIFWAKPLPAQNDGLCQAHALPFCAGNFNGDLFCHFSLRCKLSQIHECA